MGPYPPLLLYIVVDEVSAEDAEHEAERADRVQQTGVIHLDLSREKSLGESKGNTRYWETETRMVTFRITMMMLVSWE